MDFHLTEFDAVTPNLDLKIQPTEVFDFSVRTIPDLITCPVQFAPVPVERICHEPLSRHLGAIQIAIGSPSPPMYNSPGIPTGTRRIRRSRT